jgi:hypothetical protein
MKKQYILVMLAVLVLGFASPARASLYADFWAVDSDGGGVYVDLSLFTTPATLWGSSNGTAWFQLAETTTPFSALTTKMYASETSQVFLRLDLAETPSPFMKSMAVPDEPKLFFSGAKGDGLYNALAIQWTGLGSQFAFSTLGIQGADSLSSENPVPIPPAGLLFSTGLLGFVALRRKSRLTAQ